MNSFQIQIKDSTNSNLAFLCATDDRNLPFVLPFIYFASKYNPLSQFDIHIFKNIKRDYSKLNDGIRFLMNNCNVHNVNVNYVVGSNHKPQHYRFIVHPTLNTEYTYIGDIDIMICESIKEFHLAKMKGEYVYDNELRGYSDPSRLSGLHFASKAWFEQTYKYRQKILNEKNLEPNDEKLLADIAKKSKVKLRPILTTQQAFNASRPIYGQHISLSRKPFKNNSPMHVVID